MMAHARAGNTVPAVVREALEAAMEVASANVPAIEGQVYVCLDVSGSMESPVTGYRPGATSKVRCRDVGALIASVLLRRNPRATVLPFNDRLHTVALDPRDSVFTNAERLAGLPNGGTNCSLPLAWLNAERRHADLVVFVSDFESWIDSQSRPRTPWARPTETMREWEALRARCPQAKLACIDLTPYGTVQAPERADVLNVGGFSDAVFDVLAAFAQGGLAADHWVGVIEGVAL
ncbi:MAG TPA: hypothetical protein VK066_27420 [Chloroflexota bacterium]|nr:hypothetical protein [Chloroflexota bacterium]